MTPMNPMGCTHHVKHPITFIVFRRPQRSKAIGHKTMACARPFLASTPQVYTGGESGLSTRSALQTVLKCDAADSAALASQFCLDLNTVPSVYSPLTSQFGRESNAIPSVYSSLTCAIQHIDGGPW